MNPDPTRFGHPLGLVVEDTGDELLIHRPGVDNTFYLNGTAALIWHLCDGQRDESEIISLLIDAYPDQADTIRAEVPDVLIELVENGVLESV